MFWFVITIVLLFIAAIVFLFAPSAMPSETGNGVINAKRFGWVFVIIAVFTLLPSLITVVGTRNVGVEKFMSATTGRTMGAGPHFKAPWDSVSDIDATIQPEEYTTDNPIKVKIGDLGEAKIALAYRWRINPDGAANIYKDYRNSDDITQSVRKALVSTNIKAALNEELGTYNPLADVKITANMTPEEISKVIIPPIPYAQLNAAVKANLEDKIKDLGDLIEIESVTISHLALPDGTQNKINSFNAKVQESKNTLIDVATKEAQARGNIKLAASLHDPNVLVSKCFDSLEDGSFTAPAGFSCWPGNNGSVVIPSAK